MSSSAKPRVLVIDDAFSARITLVALLEDAGYEVAEAESVGEGRQKIRAGEYDLAIVDLHLKDGLGTELLPDLHRDQPRAVIAMLTGDQPEALEGVALYLTKSAAPGVILEQLAAALAGAHATEAR